MSNRKQAFETSQPNPATMFIEWKSDDRKFSYFNKDIGEKGEKVAIDLPFKFLVLEQMHTVKGWNDASESGIYSNEVKYIGKEPVNVRSFKGGDIANGLYKDIKQTISEAGGVYHKSIYIMLEGGILANVALKGSSVREWSEFTQKTVKRLYDEWVTVGSAREEKKGSINYSVPVFEFDGSLCDEDAQLANDTFDVLEAYLIQYKKNGIQSDTVEDATPDQHIEAREDDPIEPDWLGADQDQTA